MRVLFLSKDQLIEALVKEDILTSYEKPPIGDSYHCSVCSCSTCKNDSDYCVCYQRELHDAIARAYGDEADASS